MDLQTVSDVSSKYGISTRMLRYYDEMGLLCLKNIVELIGVYYTF